MSGSFPDGPADSNWREQADSNPSSSESARPSPSPEEKTPRSGQSPSSEPSEEAIPNSPDLVIPHLEAPAPPIAMVETAFLASTASLLWLVSYYLGVGPWMRIFFPAPIALVYLRWGNRAAWMAAVVSWMLLNVLMGPYLSLLFLMPYGLLGVQLGALWKRQARWIVSMSIGTIVVTISFFFRLWLLSSFIGEDLWIYLTNRITDLVEWFANLLVNWGILGIGMLGQPNLQLIQIVTIVVIVLSDFIYLFSVHLISWMLLERLGNPIPDPPEWVQVLMEED